MKHIVFALCLFSLAGSVAAASDSTLDDPTAALLIIDIQDFYFAGGSVPLVGAEAASGNAGRLLDAFRKHGRMIVHVGHQVSRDGGFHADVAPRPDEIIIMKSEVNAFLDAD